MHAPWLSLECNGNVATVRQKNRPPVPSERATESKKPPTSHNRGERRALPCSTASRKRMTQFNSIYDAKKRRLKPARATRPVPSRLNIPGSGTVLVLGVTAAKQVGELPQNAPATWMFPTVIPVETSALLSTKNSELAVALPVVSRQIVSFPIPPHAPIASEKPANCSIQVQAYSRLVDPLISAIGNLSIVKRGNKT
jgi:hypothetical protein